MNEAYVRVEKQLREKHRQKYPNLAKNPVYITVQNFSTNFPLHRVKREKLKQLTIALFTKYGMRTKPEKYPLQEKETVNIVWNGKGENPLYREEIKIPKQYRGKDPKCEDIFEQKIVIGS